MLLVVGGIKGGVGKSTISTNLAQLRTQEGYKVLLVDADEQQSAWEWSLQRDHNGLGLNHLGRGKCALVTVCMTGKAVYSNILKMKADYDDIIVDTGGRDTTSQRAALCDADKFLVPFNPSSVDIWTLGKIKRMINECTNYKLKTYGIISRADPRGNDNDEALQLIREYEDIIALDCHIGNRKAFRNAYAEGYGVHELEPREEKACKEIKDLYDRIYS